MLYAMSAPTAERKSCADDTLNERRSDQVAEVSPVLLQDRNADIRPRGR